MQAAPAGNNALTLARSRARKWFRIFQQLVRVLDRLEQQPESLLASSLVFLVQRALGHLETGDPTAPTAPARPLELETSDCNGDELLAAVDLARHARERRDARDDPACDELEVLLVLAGALTEPADAGAFGDLSIAHDEIVREYRSLQHLSPADVMRVELFPLPFRKRWAALLQGAASTEVPLRRLGIELSVMKVIHALYAMAVGYRRAAAFDRPEEDGDAWLAYTLGEATLRLVRR